MSLKFTKSSIGVKNIPTLTWAISLSADKTAKPSEICRKKTRSATFAMPQARISTDVGFIAGFTM